MASILGQAEKVRAKRAAENDGGSAISKRSKSAMDFVSLVAGNAGGGDDLAGETAGGLDGGPGFHEGSSLNSADLLTMLSSDSQGRSSRGV